MFNSDQNSPKGKTKQRGSAAAATQRAAASSQKQTAASCQPRLRRDKVVENPGHQAIQSEATANCKNQVPNSDRKSPVALLSPLVSSDALVLKGYLMSAMSHNVTELTHKGSCAGKRKKLSLFFHLRRVVSPPKFDWSYWRLLLGIFLSARFLGIW